MIYFSSFPIKFNELCKELYTRTSNLIDDTLRMAKLGTDDINYVVNNHEKPFHSGRKYLPQIIYSDIGWWVNKNSCDKEYFGNEIWTEEIKIQHQP